jgi:hypothetical protein
MDETLERKSNNRERLSMTQSSWPTTQLLIAILLASSLAAFGGDSGNESASKVRVVELRGHVVCLAEEMNRAHQALLPTKHEHLWGFRAEDGACYTLLRSKFSEAIFVDARLREKNLLLKGSLFPNSHLFEVSTLHSIRNGVVQDLYYYCDICAIKAVSPEPCACCQGPVQLIEEPLTDRSE